MQAVAGWVAPLATMLAAMMTAANLGARVTGWGFVVFLVGSLAWSAVAIGTGQANLLWTNGFLTLVNLVGVWRWLGRQARYADGGKAATTKSTAATTPTLFAFGALTGAKVTDPEGAEVGAVVDGMLDCEDGRVAYLVITDGGLGGVGERLFAVAREHLVLSPDGVRCRLTADAVRAGVPLKADAWPAVLPPR